MGTALAFITGSWWLFAATALFAVAYLFAGRLRYVKYAARALFALTKILSIRTFVAETRKEAQVREDESNLRAAAIVAKRGFLEGHVEDTEGDLTAATIGKASLGHTKEAVTGVVKGIGFSLLVGITGIISIFFLILSIGLNIASLF